MTTLKCDWCGEEVEERMMTQQSNPVEHVCLHCLCKMHPNLIAHQCVETRIKLANKQKGE